MQSPSLTTQDINIRQLGINLNHWYVVAKSSEIQAQPVGVTLWNQPIVLYRDNSGTVYALEDRCPHRQVKLSHGHVIVDRLECKYHGWQFKSSGECAAVPNLAANQKLPNCKIPYYPVKEQDGFIWLFSGNVETLHSSSINLMDMYHGHLHQDWQAWANPVLEDIKEDANRVDAHYQALSYYKIDKIWSISQLFFPALRRLHPEPLDVSYVYPHWVSTLGKDFKIYCLLCPVSETQTRAYLIHFTSLNAFWRLHKLPIWFRRFVKNSLFGSAQKLLDGLVRQDVQMIEEEQQAYLNHPERKSYELNRALVSVQRLIRSQGERG